jgi:hypothetical protein
MHQSCRPGRIRPGLRLRNEIASSVTFAPSRFTLRGADECVRSYIHHNPGITAHVSL